MKRSDWLIIKLVPQNLCRKHVAKKLKNPLPPTRSRISQTVPRIKYRYLVVGRWLKRKKDKNSLGECCASLGWSSRLWSCAPKEEEPRKMFDRAMNKTIIIIIIIIIIKFS
jgi:hypothetical protein